MMDTASIAARVAPYTQTEPEHVTELVELTERVVRNGTEGAIVECGVWKGGSMMAVALTLIEMGRVDRDLYLFDTFTGMSAPGEEDVNARGEVAAENYREGWGVVPLDDVTAAMETTGYPSERVHYVVGKVEDTIPEHAPAKIALLRLDTDWYASTRHELEHLFPLVSVGGVVIIDDYGHWKGARKATDEYIQRHAPRTRLRQCGYSVVVMEKDAA